MYHHKTTARIRILEKVFFENPLRIWYPIHDSFIFIKSIGVFINVNWRLCSFFGGSFEKIFMIFAKRRMIKIIGLKQVIKTLMEIIYMLI
jgi:hypothetical protein